MSYQHITNSMSHQHITNSISHLRDSLSYQHINESSTYDQLNGDAIIVLLANDPLLLHTYVHDACLIEFVIGMLMTHWVRDWYVDDSLSLRLVCWWLVEFVNGMLMTHWVRDWIMTHSTSHIHITKSKSHMHMTNSTYIWREVGGWGRNPKKMYGERLGDGVENHLMSPTPRR